MVLENIRRICAEKDISIAEACRRAEISRDTVMDWDKHSPSIDKVLKMAEVLDVYVDELLRKEAT